MRKMGLIQVFCVLSIGLILTEGRYVIEAPNPGYAAMSIPNESYASCQKLVSKALVDLLVSEYNRVTTSNALLHVKAGTAVVQCKGNDENECAVTVELSKSTCKRSTSTFWYDCPPTFVMEDLKRCTGSISLATATIVSPLSCRGDASDQSVGFYPNVVSGYATGQRMISEDGNEIMKKKWDSKDGSPQPF